MNPLSLEAHMALGAHHLESLVDDQGRTYFDVFATTPPEAVTDWPDFVDIPARYLEAGVMIAPVLGRQITTRPALEHWLYQSLGSDGLGHRPDSSITTEGVELFDQSRLLIALVTFVMAEPENAIHRERLLALLHGLRALATFTDDYAYIEKIDFYFGGTLIRPLAQAGVILSDPQWIHFGAQLARGIFFHADLFADDGSFHGHMHSALGTIAGTLVVALLTHDGRLQERANAVFAYIRAHSTSFGFVPELAQRQDDLVACETCGIMDYLDAAILFARYVDASYWQIVERVTRNHLIASQVQDRNWLGASQEMTDDDGIIRSRLGERLLGAFAGWSSPIGLLAYAETHGEGWPRNPISKERYLDKVRALQNCCSGAGIRSLHQAWSSIVIKENDTLTVTMLITKETPDIMITSLLPVRGEVTFVLKTSARVRVRIPTTYTDIQWYNRTTQTALTPSVSENGFCDLGMLSQGTTVVLTCTQVEWQEAIEIGNEGFQAYRFTATWLGETVTNIVANGTNPQTGYSRLIDRSVPVYAVGPGNGPLYQEPVRIDYLEPLTPTLDEGRIDWYGLPGYTIVS